MPDDASGSHYFSANIGPQGPDSDPSTAELTVDGQVLTVTSDTGVFSHGHIDEGTDLLIRRGARPQPGVTDVLDLGCGYGPIAMALAVRCPSAHIWAVDTNHRAVALCQANAAANDLGNIRAVAVDPEPPLAGLDPDIRFDAIWSNPPIRVGKKAMHALLVAALGRLKPGGEAHLVVHKHLGSDSLQRWLEAAGYPTTRRLSRLGYRLLDVRGDARPPGGPDSAHNPNGDD